MKKKGFTLVELLAVIAILGLLIAIIAPVVTNLVRDNEDALYEEQINNFVNAAKEYVILNDTLLTDSNSTLYIDSYDLIDNGIITNDQILNPKTKEILAGCVVVNYNSDFNQYEYNYDSTCVLNSRIYEFAYNGREQKFTASKTGYYKVELWGAQGNSPTSNRAKGGNGAYTSGVINLQENDSLFIYVGESRNDRNASFNCGTTGGEGRDTANSGSYNGYGGGGATDVRLVSGNGSWDNATSLASRIMVAAGGGGATDYAYAANGGYGGALIGGSGINGKYPSNGSVNIVPTGGTQIAGGATSSTSYPGTAGVFGKGGNGNSDWGSGAGGGYYGGGGGGYTSYSVDSGAGGSSYISGYTGCVAITSDSDTSAKAGCTTGTTDNSCSIHYSLKKFTDGVMKAGNETMPTHDGSSVMAGNTGNGFAKITYLGM